MTTTESKSYKGYTIEQEAFLKVGNYQNSIFEAINEAKDYISRNNCRLLSIDASDLNMIDAMKVCVLASTFHFAKYCGGRIKWFVRDENIKNQIESIEISSSLTTIGSYFFHGLSHLTDIGIPEGITTIKTNAISECSHLKSLVLPESLITIPHYTLINLKRLKELTISSQYKLHGDRFFVINDNHLLVI